MRTIERVIEYKSRKTVVKFTPVFDLHYGSVCCDEDRFKSKVKEIAADPNHYWGLGGDMCEFITIHDKRYGGQHELAPWLRGKKDIITRSVQGFLEIVDPIKEKCWFAALGNHDWYIEYLLDRDGYRDIITHLSGVTEVEDSPIALGMEGFVVCRFRRLKTSGGPDTWTVVLYVHHGYGGGRLAGAHALDLERTLKDMECDIALKGHRHVVQYVPNTKVRPSAKGDKTEQRTQGAMFCGTYRDMLIDTVEADYSTRAGYPPKKTQQVELIFTPDKKRAQVLIDII